MTRAHHIRILGHRLQFRDMAPNRGIESSSRHQQFLDTNWGRRVVVNGGNLQYLVSVIIVDARDTTLKYAPINRGASKVILRARLN